MTGNWKTNQGSAMLEQMPITEKYKNWIDEVKSGLRIEMVLIRYRFRYESLGKMITDE